jgi:hypothetical protein
VHRQARAVCACCVQPNACGAAAAAAAGVRSNDTLTARDATSAQRAASRSRSAPSSRASPCSGRRSGLGNSSSRSTPAASPTASSCGPAAAPPPPPPPPLLLLPLLKARLTTALPATRARTTGACDLSSRSHTSSAPPAVPRSRMPGRLGLHTPASSA